MKSRGGAAAAVLGFGQQPPVNQRVHGANTVTGLDDPIQGVKVAQPALALLDVGLHDIAGIAHPLMAFVPLRKGVANERFVGLQPLGESPAQV